MAKPTAEFLHIYLIGFMGSGKSYWGKKWAAKAGLPFYDLEEIVEEAEDKTAAEIFAEYGEEKFRELETIALQSLINKPGYVLACGGGTPCFNDNLTWMNKNGTTVYLQSSPENIFKRLRTEKEKRPLIKNLQEQELLFYISEKIKEREPYYSQAEITLNVDELPDNYIPHFLIV